jgi:oligoribonuclease NrnB/cAMP/cGMP phosphodiesterase (DHH superfamily)
MKVKLFTHSDLDGLGCVVVATQVFSMASKSELDFTICENNNVNEKVLDFLDNEKPSDYDLILITDISVNEDVAEKLDLLYRGRVTNIQLLDHHNTAKWLNKYDWAYVNDKDEFSANHKSSGTSMLLQYLMKTSTVSISSSLIKFVELVRRYDTWEWFNLFDDDHAKKLNDLLYLIGKEKFLARFVSNPSPSFYAGEELLLEVEGDRIEAFLKKKVKQVKFHTLLGYDNVAVVYADQYTSELGNYIAREVECDFVLMIDIANGKVSYRGVREDIDLGLVAKDFGGGGHPRASGSSVADLDYIKTIIFTEIFE